MTTRLLLETRYTIPRLQLEETQETNPHETTDEERKPRFQNKIKKETRTLSEIVD